MSNTRQRLVVSILAASLVGAGCGRGVPAPLESPTATHELPPGSVGWHDASIFDLDLELTDHDGRALRLSDTGGHVTVAAMVYTSCTDVCILVTEQMKAIERQLAAVDLDVRYTLFSLDPGRDTPEAMREFARSHRLDTTRWQLMAASEDGVRNLAAVLGVRYQIGQNGQIAHSAMIFVIDPTGVVRHRQVGVGQNPDELVTAVRRAQGA